MSAENEIPKCRECRHYYITYIPARPYGCRAMRFTSKRNPAIVVYESSGLICQLFSPKNPGPSNRDNGWTA